MMHRARTEEGIPFSAFSLAHLLSTGQYTVLSYESPSPVLVRQGAAELLPLSFFTRGHEVVVGAASGHLRPGEALMLMTDGVTQAGLGRMKGTGRPSSPRSHPFDRAVGAGLADRTERPARARGRSYGPRRR